MGQYRQWLHYRDIDRRLRTQREQLIQHITKMHESIPRSETLLPDADNTIVQALIQAQHSSPSLITKAPVSVSNALSTSRQAALTSSASLSSQSQQSIAPPRVPNPQTPPPSYAPLPPLLPQHRGTLLPEDVNAFLDAHSQTDPQLAIPKWLLRAASTPQSGPLDPQSAQTNKLVQRWLERWGKQPPASQSEREDASNE